MRGTFRKTCAALSGLLREATERFRTIHSTLLLQKVNEGKRLVLPDCKLL
jgi:hypothetical protein